MDDNALLAAIIGIVGVILAAVIKSNGTGLKDAVNRNTEALTSVVIKLTTFEERDKSLRDFIEHNFAQVRTSQQLIADLLCPRQRND